MDLDRAHKFKYLCEKLMHARLNNPNHVPVYSLGGEVIAINLANDLIFTLQNMNG